MMMTETVFLMIVKAPCGRIDIEKTFFDNEMGEYDNCSGRMALNFALVIIYMIFL